jgi:NitT/TauT family transport system substrate-binding protein
LSRTGIFRRSQREILNEQPQVAAGAVRAIVKTQRALKADPSLATRVGIQLFPAEEASLIGDLVARDAPFYDVNISLEAVDGLNRFAKANGLISEPVPYEQLVAPPFIRQLWNKTGG